MHIRYFGLILTIVLAGITFEAASQNKVLSKFSIGEIPNYRFYKTYSCTYAGLLCTCRNVYGGGCSVSCSPTIYKTLYNQTSCPRMENFYLSGFEYN